MAGLDGRLKIEKQSYSTAKGIDAANHALDAYQISKSLSILQKSQMGIYGLVLNDITSRLRNNTEATGSIKLFTELDTCTSCNIVIANFAEKYKNIKLKVIHNSRERLKPN